MTILCISLIRALEGIALEMIVALASELSNHHLYRVVVLDQEYIMEVILGDAVTQPQVWTADEPQIQIPLQLTLMMGP